MSTKQCVNKAFLFRFPLRREDEGRKLKINKMALGLWPPLSSMRLTYLMASDTFPAVALTRVSFHVEIVESNTTRAKWSSLWRSFRMASNAVRVCASDTTRWAAVFGVESKGEGSGADWKPSHLRNFLPAHRAALVDHKHNILWHSGQIGWREEVHKVAVDNLERQRG